MIKKCIHLEVLKKIDMMNTRVNVVHKNVGGHRLSKIRRF